MIRMMMTRAVTTMMMTRMTTTNRLISILMMTMTI